MKGTEKLTLGKDDVVLYMQCNVYDKLYMTGLQISGNIKVDL